jgi:hypothetical protein
MKRILLPLMLSFSILCSLNAQVNVSEAFQKTIKKIAKEQVKKEVVNWVGKQDVVLGIVARDLITQLIDNGNDQRAILKSTANVTTTMLYMAGVRKLIEDSLKVHAEVIDSAKQHGFSKDELIAYSALYYYFSERLKYKLYVSSEILKMQNIKNTIEGLKLKDGKKWVTEFSGFLTRLKHNEKDRYLWLDVRVLEFAQFGFSKLLIEPKAFIASVESAKVSLSSSVKDTNFNSIDGVKLLKRIAEYLIQANTGSFKANVFVLDKSLLDTQPLDAANLIARTDTVINNILAEPFNNLIQTSDLGFVDAENAKDVILSIVRQLLEEWMNAVSRSGWKFEYTFSLGGTYLNNYSSSIDFTILDQFRLVRRWESVSAYAFIGGVFDPIIKNTVYKEGIKVYLVGVGAQYSNLHINLVLGIPYTDLKGEYGKGVSLGYAIPIFDVFE